MNPIVLRSGADRARSAVRSPDPHTPSTLDFDGAKYLVSGGNTHWIRNLRAAGRGELRWAGPVKPFRAAEVHGTEHDRVVQANHEHMVWRAREFFAALPDPADHPVFRIAPPPTTPGQTR